MKSRINKEQIFAKLFALNIIYTKDESCRQVFLKRISYNPLEMTAVLEKIDDLDFRSWIEASIPMMQCRKVS